MCNAVDFTYVAGDTKLAAIEYCMTSDDPVISSHYIILLDTQRELG